MLGGIAVAKWGTTRTFAGYGLLCTVVLAAFAFVNFRGGEAEGAAGTGGPGVDEEARAVAEAGVLAPHGVPSNPLPRALSSTRLADLAHHDSYGATQVTTGLSLVASSKPKSLICSFIPQSYSGASELNVPGQAPAPRPSNPFLAEQSAGPAYR